jgi:hypothetical protein
MIIHAFRLAFPDIRCVVLFALLVAVVGPKAIVEQSINEVYVSVGPIEYRFVVCVI